MRESLRRAVAPAIVALSAGVASAAPADFPAELDSYVAQSLQDWDVPGAVRWESPVADSRMTFISFAPDEQGKGGKLHLRAFGEDIDAERIADGGSG